MSPLPVFCIAVIAGGSVTILPAPTVTLRWIHTVEGSAWEEDYTTVAGLLRLEEARISGIGAGMEPPANARRNGDVWRYAPDLPPLSRIDLANSAYARGYDLCWDEHCAALNSIVPRGLPVALFAQNCVQSAATAITPDVDGGPGR